jgi:competence protein ComEC
VQLVTVPHHGSRTSSTQPFVDALGADIALVSAAHGNHWGFPREEVVQRWQQSGAQVLNTANSGAVEIEVCADSGLRSIRRYRVLKRRIWHE